MKKGRDGEIFLAMIIFQKDRSSSYLPFEEPLKVVDRLYLKSNLDWMRVRLRREYA